METNDDFNRIVEMNTEAERRKIAAMIMASMISNDYYAQNLLHSQIAGFAVELADILIAELKKKKDE